MIALLLALAWNAPPDPPPTADQLAGWVADLGGTDANKRFAARTALIKAGPLANAHVPELVKLVERDDSGFVAEVLGAIGPDARAAVPALTAKLAAKNGNTFAVQQLVDALVRIDRHSPDVVRALMQTRYKSGQRMLHAHKPLAERPADVLAPWLVLCAHADKAVRRDALLALDELVFPRRASGPGTPEGAGLPPNVKLLAGMKELPTVLAT